MRTIVNLPLPEEMVREINKEVKRGKYASVSEYFRHLWRERQQAQLARHLEQKLREGILKSFIL
jgi:Arc/MetJ-type ribon-helix-helix transcriptional regulator